MIRRPPRSTPLYSSAASDVYKRQHCSSISFPKHEPCKAKDLVGQGQGLLLKAKALTFNANAKDLTSRPRTQNLSLRTRQSQGPKPRTTTLHLAVVVSGRFRGGLDAFLRAKAVTALARLSHRNSVCPSVTRVDQSKKVQARITKSSPSAACLKDSKVSGTVKIFHKFEGRHSERGR